MRRPACALLLAAVLPLAGCHHRSPAIVVLPPAPLPIEPVMVSVPPPTHPTEPLPGPPVPVAEIPAVIPPPPKKPHKRKAVPPPAPPPPVVAAIAPAPIELGQLSAGGNDGNGLRSETESMLVTQKARVAKLSPAILTAHAADVDQARRFLKGAEAAWNTGDIEGAHTLVAKAKVLVDDLSQ